jgi:hypothetical protein
MISRVAAIFIDVLMSVAAIAVGCYGLVTGRELLTGDAGGPWWYWVLLIALGLLALLLTVVVMSEIE